MTDQETPSAGADWTCSRCKKPTARMEEPPFPTELGKKIHDRICEPCWKEWMAMSVRVINEYRLNLMSPEASKIYDSCMCEFLELDSAGSK